MKYSILAHPQFDDEQLVYKALVGLNNTDVILVHEKKKIAVENVIKNMAQRLGLNIETSINPTGASESTIIFYADSNTFEIHKHL